MRAFTDTKKARDRLPIVSCSTKEGVRALCNIHMYLVTIHTPRMDDAEWWRKASVKRGFCNREGLFFLQLQQEAATLSCVLSREI